MRNEKNKPTSLKSIRLRDDVIKKVEKMAENDNRTFTNMVETILIRESQRQQQLNMM